ncbi:hypothetical protein GEMRC1_004846 [Eukaryota sp. GEM-RC1]
MFVSATDPAFDGKNFWLDESSGVDLSYFKFENSDYQNLFGKGYTKQWNNDRILVRQLKNIISDFDSTNFKKSPIFSLILSVSTHMPYTTFDLPSIVGSPLPASKEIDISVQ